MKLKLKLDFASIRGILAQLAMAARKGYYMVRFNIKSAYTQTYADTDTGTGTDTGVYENRFS